MTEQRVYRVTRSGKAIPKGYHVVAAERDGTRHTQWQPFRPQTPHTEFKGRSAGRAAVEIVAILPAGMPDRVQVATLGHLAAYISETPVTEMLRTQDLEPLYASMEEQAQGRPFTEAERAQRTAEFEVSYAAQDIISAEKNFEQEIAGYAARLRRIAEEVERYVAHPGEYDPMRAAERVQSDIMQGYNSLQLYNLINRAADVCMARDRNAAKLASPWKPEAARAADPAQHPYVSDWAGGGGVCRYCKHAEAAHTVAEVA